MRRVKRELIKFILLILRVSAKIQLKKINPIIIGIAGSSGKSSTTLISAHIFRNSATIKQSGGKNSETGIPLNILNIKLEDYSVFTWIRVVLLIPFRILFDWRKYKYYIVEMGIDSPFPPKNMAYLLKIIKPRVGVVTNVSLEHSLNFDVLVKDEEISVRKAKILELTAKEELGLLKALGKEDTSVVNLDDLKTKQALPEIRSKIISVSKKDKSADFFLDGMKLSLKDFKLSFRHKEKLYELKINRPLPSHYGYSILISIATASIFMEVKDIINFLEKDFSIPPGRFSVFKGINDSTIIDSSYNNATLEPITDILEFVKEAGDKRRKLAVVGDMRELGSMTQDAHKLLAHKLMENLDEVILIGPALEKYTAPVLRDHRFNFRSFKTFTDAKYFIHQAIAPNDLVLVKGSQNTLLLERVVDMLLLDSSDKENLCRRGKYWDYKRQSTP